MHRTVLSCSLAAILWTAGPSEAGTVRVETTVATEIRLATIPVVKTYGAGTVSLPDVAAGLQEFEVYRYGKARSIRVDVPETGTVRLLVGEDTLTTDTPPTPDAAEHPKVRLTAAPGERFSILVNGDRVALLHDDQPLLLDALPPGNHRLEVRSIDNLTIWTRGTLSLEPGDDLQLKISEGRLPEVFGRAEAWRPK